MESQKETVVSTEKKTGLHFKKPDITCKIYSYPNGSNSYKSEIAAKFCGNVKIEYPPFEMGKDNKTPEFLKKNPNGQVPTMDTPDGPLWESNAMAKYVARKGNDPGLYGTTDYETSQIDQWIEFFRSRLERSISNLIYPVFGWAPFNQEAHDQAKIDVVVAFGVLNGVLNGRSYIVGNRPTLAEVILIPALQRSFSIIFDPEFLAPFPNVVQWFKRCVALPEFKSVLGEIKYCEKEAAPGSLKDD